MNKSAPPTQGHEPGRAVPAARRADDELILRPRHWLLLLLPLMVALNAAVPDGSAAFAVDWTRQHVVRGLADLRDYFTLLSPAIDKGDRNGLNPH